MYTAECIYLFLQVILCEEHIKISFHLVILDSEHCTHSHTIHAL